MLNLITNNTFNDFTGWTVTGDCIISNSVVQLNSGSVSQTFPARANVKYKFSGYGQNSCISMDFMNGSTFLGANVIKFDSKWQYKEITCMSPSNATAIRIRAYNGGTVDNLWCCETGKAILIEEGTTNLCNNGGGEISDLSQWAGVNGSSIERVTNTVYSGNYAIKMTHTDPNTTYCGRGRGITISAGTAYTFQAMVYIPDSWVQGECVLRAFRTDNYAEISAALPGFLKSTTTKGQWVRLVATVPTSNTYSGTCIFSVYIHNLPSTNSGYFVFIDNYLLEQKPYPTSFIDGTRDPEMLTIPTANVLNPNEGTIEFWTYLPVLRPNGYQPLVSTATYNYFPGPRLLIMREFSGANVNNVCVWDGNGTTEAYLSSNIQLQVGSWYYIAYTWSMAGRKLFINGSLVATNAKSEPIAMGVDINIGNWAASDFLDGYIESFRISNIARTDAEIAADYNSKQPLPFDEHTTFKLKDGIATIRPYDQLATGYMIKSRAVNDYLEYVLDQPVKQASFWMKLDTNEIRTENRYILRQSDDISSHYWELYIRNNTRDLVFEVKNGSEYRRAICYDINSTNARKTDDNSADLFGDWHFISIWINDYSCAMQVDDKIILGNDEIITVPFSSVVELDSNLLGIGCKNYFNPANVLIDELRLDYEPKNKLMYAADLNGINNRIESDNAPAISFENHDFTIEADVMLRRLNNNEPIVIKGNANYGLTQSNGWAFMIGDGTQTYQITSTLNYETFAWHHITGVYSSGSLSLYVDGVLAATGVAPFTPDINDDKLYIGSDGTHFTDMMVKDVRIWNIAKANADYVQNPVGLVYRCLFFDKPYDVISQINTTLYGDITDLSDLPSHRWYIANTPFEE